MNVNQSTLNMICEVRYGFVVITPDGSFVASSRDLTLKKLLRSLIKYYEAESYHTAYVTPVARGMLGDVVQAKPVEVTREELERVIKHIDFYSK